MAQVLEKLLQVGTDTGALEDESKWVLLQVMYLQLPGFAVYLKLTYELCVAARSKVTPFN